MPPAPATLNEFIDTLSNAAPHAAAVFQADGRDIGPGYHITELKLADIHSIDCGGRQARWQEAQLQLLDGQDGERLTVGKVRGILEQSRAALPGLGAVPLSVEFAHGNRGLQRFTLGAPDAGPDRVGLPLINVAAQCKPAVETGCCGAGSACCG